MYELESKGYEEDRGEAEDRRERKPYRKHASIIVISGESTADFFFLCSLLRVD